MLDATSQPVGPGLTEFRIDRMAFGQPESSCLSIQKQGGSILLVTLLYDLYYGLTNVLLFT